ncbi:DUF4231 domain-containing protein [Nocardia sp. NPDC003482]
MEDVGRGEDPAAIVWRRLEEQRRWYSARSRVAQRTYKQVKVAQIVVGAIVPVLAGVGAAGWLTASVAAVVVVAEGMQQLFQWQATWLSYRAVAESLRREGFLYLAEAGAYGAADRHKVLAERVEAITAEENTGWVSRRRSGSEKSSG